MLRAPVFHVNGEDPREVGSDIRFINAHNLSPGRRVRGRSVVVDVRLSKLQRWFCDTDSRMTIARPALMERAS